MNVLALDTCFGACSVAVGVGLGGPSPRTEEFFEPMSSGQAERLVPMIEEALVAAKLSMGDIDRIAVTTGPGTFTGTRICVAAARALALSHKIPIVEYSSLEVLAHHQVLVDAFKDRDVLVAMHPTRGETYVQHFAGADRKAKSEPMMLRFEDAAKLGGPRAIAVVGSAADAVVAAAGPRDISAAHQNLLPRIGDILWTAANRAPLTAPPRPLYLRPPDAKPQDGKSLPRAPL